MKSPMEAKNEFENPGESPLTELGVIDKIKG